MITTNDKLKIIHSYGETKRWSTSTINDPGITVLGAHTNIFSTGKTENMAIDNLYNNIAKHMIKVVDYIES